VEIAHEKELEKELTMEKNTIRVAAPGDAKALLEIYAPYVTDTAITFEYNVPSVSEFERRICHTLEKYPYLAAEQNGELVGYAYAGVFNKRAAASWAVETSLYVRRDCKKQGIGKKLYLALEQALSLQHVINLNACIACPEAEDPYLTKNSIQFHEHFGYRFVGEFHRCGYKFSRWYNLVWMEKHLQSHPEHPLPLKSFDEVRKELAALYGIV
jgi:L-amino acid N-acyltransferase YncA